MLPLAYFSLALVARAPTSVGFDDRDCNCGDDRKCHNEQHWKNAQEHGLKIALARAPLVLPPLAPPPLEKSIVVGVKKEPHMTKTKTKPGRAAVLTKAMLRAADLLGLKDAELARVIGASPANVAGYRSGVVEIDPASKAGARALLLVRLFRALHALVGGDGEKRKAWIHSTNDALGGVPATLILKPEGLSSALAYLDAIRAPGGLG